MADKTLFSPVIILVIGCKLESILIRLVWSRFTALLSLLMTNTRDRAIKQKTNPLGCFNKDLIVFFVIISL